MKKKLLALVPYAIALGLAYYLLPFIVKNTGLAMLVMLAGLPLVTFTGALLCGVRQGFSPLLALCAALLFAPSIFIFYNYTAWPYIPAYGILALAGNGIGVLFYKKR